MARIHRLGSGLALAVAILVPPLPPSLLAQEACDPAPGIFALWRAILAADDRGCGQAPFSRATAGPSMT